MLARGHLPLGLQQVLSNPNIKKVGRGVGADLKYLQQAVNPTNPFVGGIDLAKFAKDRLLIPSAKIGLADLCASILGKQLAKNVAERVSSAWENNSLTPAQKDYAALDVYACLCIYEACAAVPLPTPVTDNVQFGTHILLLNDDRTRIIARGTITGGEGEYAGVKITKARCVIEITKVLVPAAIIKTHNQSLSSFGRTPFNLVCTRNHLRLSTPINLPAASSSVLPPPIPLVEPEVETSTEKLPELDGALHALESDPSGFGALLLEEAGTAIPSDHTVLETHQVDSASQQEGERVLGQINVVLWLSYIRSRVLKDAFHIFNMFYISVSHGLRIEFARALRDAIFIIDAEDKGRIVAWGQRQNPPQDFAWILRRAPAWVLRRCKRIIPPPEQLYPLVLKVFQTYGPLKDATTGLPLFNSAAWAVAKNVLELIRKGFLSDPPGIPLYYQLGVDKFGLRLYRCFRGTNFTEGGVHTHLRSRLPTSGAGIRHVCASLKDFILRHNLVVSCNFDLVYCTNGTFRSVFLTEQGTVILVITAFGSQTKFKSFFLLLPGRIVS